MINLENLRKQAKQYVRWHRERRWTVAEVIRSTLARYARLTDGEILDATFRLADAPELVARRAGFEDWTMLVAAAREGADRPRERAAEPTPVPRVLVARPFVFVRDVRAACAYYVDVLGFELAFDCGRPPFYAEVERDGVRLCIRHTDQAMIDPAAAVQEDVILASFEVTDAKALYRELEAAKARFSQPLRVEPYGTRGFIVDDPDGNRILFFDRYAARSDDRAEDTDEGTPAHGEESPALTRAFRHGAVCPAAWRSCSPLQSLASRWSRTSSRSRARSGMLRCGFPCRRRSRPRASERCSGAIASSHACRSCSRRHARDAAARSR